MKKKYQQSQTYKPKKYPAESAAPAAPPAAKGEKVICDSNIQPGIIKLSIPPYLPSDNHFLTQLYENPATKTLECGDLKMDRDQFVKILRNINLSLLYVRSLPFSEFWCAMLDKNVKDFLDSFPLNFDPFLLDYLGKKPLDESMIELSAVLRSILKSVLLIYHRISYRSYFSREDNATYEMSPKCYSKVVFDSFLIDTAKLLDLCSVYGKSNPSLVAALIFSVFENEPRYYDDLVESVKILATEFRKLAQDAQIILEKPGETSDLNRSKILYRMHDFVKQVFSIASYFPAEGTDEVFKVKGYLWLPLIRYFARGVYAQLMEVKPRVAKMTHGIMRDTIAAGVALANTGIILRGTFVKSDY